MNVFVFEASTWLSAGCEAVYRFHENPENIRRIAPLSLRLQKVVCDRTARAGGRFRIEGSQFLLPLRWTGVWEKVEPFHLLVDTAEESPFRIWRHSHIFEPERNGCRLTDRVECSLMPFPALRLIDRIVLPFVFGPMFRARHAATRKWFENAVATGD